MAAPSLGGESFGMVLARAFGCATPVVASDIPGYDAGDVARKSGSPSRLGTRTRSRQALISLLQDEPRRRSFGEAARDRALERYSWDRLARRLFAIYED